MTGLPPGVDFISGRILMDGRWYASRDRLIEESRTWLGTPWHHAACVKGEGVDCVYFPFAVCRDLGLLPAGFVMPEYVKTPDGKKLMATCDSILTRITQAEMRPADLVVLQPDDRPQHVGIIGDEIRPGVFTIIHASNDPAVRKVVEHRLMFHRKLQFVSAYRIPGVA